MNVVNSTEQINTFVYCNEIFSDISHLTVSKEVFIKESSQVDLLKADVLE